jgi:hypothetical protein
MYSEERRTDNDVEYVRIELYAKLERELKKWQVWIDDEALEEFRVTAKEGGSYALMQNYIFAMERKLKQTLKKLEEVTYAANAAKQDQGLVPASQARMAQGRAAGSAGDGAPPAPTDGAGDAGRTGGAV